MLLRSSLRTAAVLAGSVIGAGFASGQEVLRFFALYGAAGFVGMAAAGLLFAWCGARLLLLARTLGTDDASVVLAHIAGARSAPLVRVLLPLLLFAMLTVMLAGAQSILAEHVPPPAGTLAFALVLLLLGTRGGAGTIAANVISAPLLFLAITAVSVYSLAYHGALPTVPLTAEVPPSSHWLLSAALYVSYNLVMSLPALAVLGRETTPSVARLGCLLGGAVLAVLAAAVALPLLYHAELTAEEVPMLALARMQHCVSGHVYTVILTAAMLTTSLTAYYGVTSALAKVGSRPLALLLPLALALLCSQVGFSALIAHVFPLLGYLSLFVLVRLIFLRPSRGGSRPPKGRR